MIDLSEEASGHFDDLLDHYARKKRPEAVRNLRTAINQAATRIASTPGQGLPAPRPYPSLARAGERWIKVGRYWFAYTLSEPPLIVAILYDQANMPRRR